VDADELFVATLGQAHDLERTGHYDEEASVALALVEENFSRFDAPTLAATRDALELFVIEAGIHRFYLLFRVGHEGKGGALAHAGNQLPPVALRPGPVPTTASSAPPSHDASQPEMTAPVGARSGASSGTEGACWNAFCF
jgi:hypothetical protein